MMKIAMILFVSVFLPLDMFGYVGDLNVVLGQTGSLRNVVRSVLEVFRAIAFLICVIAIVYGGYQFSQGEVRAAGLAIIGGGIIGFSAIIAEALFSATGSNSLGLDIELGF